MNPSSRSKLIRVVIAGTIVLGAILVACVAQPGPGSGGGGPQFVISSPRDGATVSGAFFFSVQAFDPSKVGSVAFTANGTPEENDFPGEDMFKVFIASSQQEDLVLTATVTGNNGRSSSQTVTVSNEPSPASNTTVGPDGAVLGSAETNGGTSLLTIPPGVGEGADVTFETRTQAEVLAATGIDYGAMGVTFLGAQEISSDQQIEGSLGVASGGFGSFVPTGHTVVNYMIAPDANDDGVDELVVVNTASVAPNGDVISDPTPQPQVASVQTTNLLGTQALGPLQNATIAGPPGTAVDIEVAGFNNYSAFGNVAQFQSLVDSSAFEMLGVVSADNSGMLVFSTFIPPFPRAPRR